MNNNNILHTLNRHSKITELMQVITSHAGMIPTDTESIVLMQDIFGHSTVEELHDAANDKQKELFYRIYGIAYGTIEAIKFYVAESEKMQELRSDVEYYKGRCEELHKSLNEKEAMIERQISGYQDKLENWKQEKISQDIKELNLTEENQKLKQEVIELKAKLYDLSLK